jgi:hypothetical protein
MPRTLDETAIRDEISGRSIRESFWVLFVFSSCRALELGKRNKLEIRACVWGQLHLT